MKPGVYSENNGHYTKDTEDFIMSTHEAYFSGLIALIREGRPTPLKTVIEARLKNNRKPVYGLASPALGKGEHDANALLYLVYQKRLEEEEDISQDAREVLRRAVVELLMTALCNRESVEYIDALGRLIGFFQVKKSPISV